MLQHAVEIEKGRASRAPAEDVNQHRRYPNCAVESSANVMGPAADVLLLLQYPLSATERIAFTYLLHRRLRRAYGGESR